MASYVEYFKMPMREIERKYTKSDLFLVSWRSQEISASIQKRSAHTPRLDIGTPAPEKPPIVKKIMDRYRSELGEMDLRKMTGNQLQRYFAGMGLMLPVMAPGA